MCGLRCGPCCCARSDCGGSRGSRATDNRGALADVHLVGGGAVAGGAVCRGVGLLCLQRDGLRLAVDGVFVVSGLLVGELFACGFLVGELFLDGLFVGELFIDRSAVIFCGFRVGRPVGVGLFGVGLFGVGFGLGLSRCVVDVVNLGGCVAVLGLVFGNCLVVDASLGAGLGVGGVVGLG